MSSTIKDQSEKIEQLFIHCQFQEALKLIKKGLKEKNISKEEELSLLAWKGRITYYLGRFPEALQLADQILTESEGLDNILTQLDALIFKSASLVWSARIIEGIQTAEQGLTMISTTKNLPVNEIPVRKAYLLYWRGSGNHHIGNFEQALEFYQEALSLAKESGYKLIISLCFTNISVIYFRFRDFKKAEDYLEKSLTIANELGNKLLIALSYIIVAYLKESKMEFKEAIEFFEKAFALTKEVGSTILLAYNHDLGIMYQKIYQLDKAKECFEEALKHSELTRHLVYVNIGYIHFLRYELEQAQEYYLNSLRICEKIKDRRIIPFVLFNLILISIELMNLSQAKVYLDRLKEISEETGFDWIDQKYRFASVLVLKASGDIGDLGQAVKLLKEILQEQDLSPYFRLDILYSLLEIRLKELHFSTNEKSLNEFRKQVIRLEVEAEEQQYQQLLANVYRLQSQLALVELDIKEAIELLDKAQIIADEINIELLMKAIREDREKIQRQSIVWNELQERKAPISETVKHVSLDTTLKNIKQETVIEEKDRESGKILEYRKLFALKI